MKQSSHLNKFNMKKLSVKPLNYSNFTDLKKDPFELFTNDFLKKGLV